LGAIDFRVNVEDVAGYAATKSASRDWLISIDCQHLATNRVHEPQRIAFRTYREHGGLWRDLGTWAVQSWPCVDGQAGLSNVCSDADDLPSGADPGHQMLAYRVRTVRVSRPKAPRQALVDDDQRGALWVSFPVKSRPRRSGIPGGSRTGAWFRRSCLSVAPRFLWECLTNRTVNWFPAPATSHVACGFPALHAPAHFTSRVMRPIRLERLPRSTVDTRRDTPRRVPASRWSAPQK
jgi:hypothetical protein